MSEKIVNVLVTGASGLLGRMIYRYLTDASFRDKYPINLSDIDANKLKFKWNCIGLCHSRVRGNLKKIDLNDFKQVDDFISNFKVRANFLY
jgi:nucleoside-diphosphate-sugar epimerase